MLVYIWYCNVRVHRILDKTLIIPSKYTLQTRFQAKENMRSFHFTKYSFLLITTVMVLQYCLIMFMSTGYLRKYEIIINYTMELCDFTHPILLIPIMMVSVPVWRRRFFVHLKFVPGVEKFVLKNNSEVAQSQTPKLETEEYFSQFKMAWG
ncbi:hypothetical protein GCK72_003731 [Caenorhabditis remanei]|uniref:Uncharacterized protein n=1 Tax=Caenorhabditis remanei TaxID=31234 RepID=A0A6A5HAB3_CAERE|nr:hypothetical protein GCK72_003731 [Caenorhabditis remanei]KAF1763786.1 hypothetical protein GCK72_003731 [Caenorhabditis remanei]